MFAILPYLNLHDMNGTPINKGYVRPLHNSLWAEEGRFPVAETHLAKARCQSAGNGISGLHTQERQMQFCICFFSVFLVMELGQPS